MTLHLELLPAQQRFLDQHFLDRRQVQPARDDDVELFLVVSNAAALPAEGERRADDEWENCPPAARISRAWSRSCATPDFATSRPIFCMASLKSCRSSPLAIASALAPMSRTLYFSKMPWWCRSIAAFKRGLTAERGQDGVRPLRRDDLFDNLHRDRLDVRARSKLRVGHDRGRVGVDENNLVTLLGQRLAGPGRRNSRTRSPVR